jgi:sulfite reductase (NADPH) flavoprotein alpha-component
MTVARLISASAVILVYLAFCGAILGAHRRKQRRAAQAAASLMEDAPAGGASVLVAFASQTGFAEQLAWQTATSLKAAGMAVRVASLAQLDAAALASAGCALFIVSTTGEGDAPDTAAGFARRVLGASAPVQLSTLRYGLLALGDRSYDEYCAFGHALDAWLRHHGAAPMFDLVDVDNGDEGALRHWQHHLGVLSGSTEMADWSAPSYSRWRLTERRWLNPGSPGGPAFHLALEPIDKAASNAAAITWRAGDIAEIGPRNGADDVERFLRALTLDGDVMIDVDVDANANADGHDADGRSGDSGDNRDGGAERRPREALRKALSRMRLPHDNRRLDALRGLTPRELISALEPLPHREYSIASVPADGRIELLVRQVRLDDGRLGLGSGWLTAHAEVGREIALRVRENRGFHPPDDDRPLILIGNGTGLAGLRAHLKARAAAGRRRNWLLFGERTSEHDYFHRAEIEAWQASGVLQRVDLAFSRDQAESIYVQHRVRDAEAELRAWVADDAAIYVCGSLEGMAAGVTAALTGIFGEEQLERMAEDGRYRRDVY